MYIYIYIYVYIYIYIYIYICVCVCVYMYNIIYKLFVINLLLFLMTFYNLFARTELTPGVVLENKFGLGKV